MSRVWDCLVAGLGAMGSAAVHHLARNGLKVLGLDSQRQIGHSFGSSGGLSRITRLCYHEGHEYVPLLKRSYDLFQELERESGKKLLHATGMVDVGPTAPKAQQAAQLHGLECTMMNGAEVSDMFPGYKVPHDWNALFQPKAGILIPEECIQVVSWRPTGVDTGVEVRTAGGNTFFAQQLVVAAGSWMTKLLPELQSLCTPVRQAVAWFEVAEEARRRGDFALGRFPCFIISEPEGDSSWYGFPEHGDQAGFKIGKYNHLHEVVNPDTMNRCFTEADEKALRTAVQRFFPEANGRVLRNSTCLFTNTPDGHFIIDRHPYHPQVLIVSACSGHGFKMSSGIGEHVAEMVLADAFSNLGQVGTSTKDIELHRFHPVRTGHREFFDRAAAAAEVRIKQL